MTNSKLLLMVQSPAPSISGTLKVNCITHIKGQCVPNSFHPPLCTIMRKNYYYYYYKHFTKEVKQ